eukprot:466479_1
MHGIKKHDNVGNKACHDNSHANNKCNHKCVFLRRNTVLLKCRMIRQSARIELYIQDAGERTVFAHQNNILLTNRKRTRSSYKISIDDRIIPFTHAKRHLILHDIITVLYGEAS